METSSSGSRLPAKPSLEYLKKLAKQRLASIRAQRPDAKLADAQLEVAREYGFSGWRALRERVARATTAPSFQASMSQEHVRRLFDAIERVDAEAVRRVLHEHPLLANTADSSGQMPLHAAAERDSPEVVTLLLDAGANASARFGNSAHTPLSWALTCNSSRAATALVEAGVKPDLFCAAALGDVRAVRGFFDGSGKLIPDASQTGSSRYDRDGKPLPRPPIDPTEIISDALYIACRNGKEAATRELIDRGADLAFRAYSGGTPLHWAHFSGSRQVIQLLLSAGADPAARDDWFDCTPRAFSICAPANWGIVRLVKARLRDDPSLARVNDGRGTPLHEAARAGHAHIAMLLLSSGADPRAQDRAGKTAADLAREGGHAELAELLDRPASSALG